ncbi:hypothetical protein ABZ707_33075 [Streptomyces sp. NPDC006923]|uniref:hypothetical protein n=1 Tax=Streptomyces sp. NPDC006923 TaxID=3155355 RepID=UPI0033D5EFAF
MSVKLNLLPHGGKGLQTLWIHWLAFSSTRKIARELPPKRPLPAPKQKESALN